MRYNLLVKISKNGRCFATCICWTTTCNHHNQCCCPSHWDDKNHDVSFLLSCTFIFMKFVYNFYSELALKVKKYLVKTQGVNWNTFSVLISAHDALYFFANDVIGWTGWFVSAMHSVWMGPDSFWSYNFRNCPGYSIVKDSNAELGVNFKAAQNRPIIKTVCSKLSEFIFAYLKIFWYFWEKIKRYL